MNLKYLDVPKGKIDVVLDTDAYNEIDDQFAIAYMLRSEEKLNVKAIYTAPFHNDRSSSPKDGMEKSYNEILKILDIADRNDLKPVVFKGSTNYLKSETEAVNSPSAVHLSELAMEYSEEKPLYVVAIGAITNVASALIMKPEIADRIVIVWLGGHAHHCTDTREFNMYQDVAAARVVFDSKAPIVQLPCNGVVSAFTTTGPELTYWLKGKNKLADYLLENTVAEAESYAKGTAWSRPIWDVTAVAWLLNDDNKFMESYIDHTPVPEYSGNYSFDKSRHPMRYVSHIHRDALFTDLFNKIAE